MQRLGHIEQRHCNRRLHNIRKILAEYKMVYDHSCICRRDRTRLPGFGERFIENDEELHKIFGNSTKKNCPLPKHIFDERIHGRQLQKKLK